LQSECYLGGGRGYRLHVFAYQVACFYAGRDSASACQQKSVADGWMKGRNSTPKQRSLCQCCLDWLVGEGLAEHMPLRSDATLPQLTINANEVRSLRIGAFAISVLSGEGIVFLSSHTRLRASMLGVRA
jgi:hypothetical protein